jgi:ubiquinone/menaquinone biosynthesis C-methylase UbiE
MSVQIAFQQSAFADMYERVIVKSIFDRYARDLVERARPIGPSERILDLGCGTGIVARVLRERLGASARLTGLDASPAMVGKARSLAPEIEWVEGNATSLPFADGAFELVLCQQMLQFVPDRLAALREVRRVLAPSGRLIVSTWRPRREQPLHDALGRIAERHLGGSKDPRFSLEGETLVSLLREVGFVDVRMDMASLVERYEELPVRATAAATSDLSAFSDEERERRLDAVVSDTAAIVSQFAIDGGYGAPSYTDVVTARKG